MLHCYLEKVLIIIPLQDVTGSSIIRALKTSVQNLGLPLLPHIYVKAGTTLLVREIG